MSFDPSRCRRLLIYGGSFDPPHRAHVQLPHQAADAVEADGTLFIPAGRPPHKQGQAITPAQHRLAMLERALAGAERVAICRHEIDRAGPSYMVDTLEHLRRERPGVQLRLLIGADMAAIFYAWQSPRRIIELAEPLVMMRPPLDLDALLATLPDDLPDHERSQWRQRIVPVQPLDISSTALRQKLADGAYDDPLVREALHPDVLAYIRETGLYRDPAEPLSRLDPSR